MDSPDQLARLVEQMRALVAQMRDNNPNRKGFNEVAPHTWQIEQWANAIEALSTRVEALTQERDYIEMRRQHWQYEAQQEHAARLAAETALARIQQGTTHDEV